MRRAFFIASVAVICFFIEVILASNIRFLRILPNILLLTTVFFTVYLGLAEGIFSAVFSGALKDALNLNMGAMNLLIFVLCALIVHYLKKFVYREAVPMIFITALVACLINTILNYFLGFFIRGVYVEGMFFLLAILDVVFTAILAPAVFFYLKKCALRFYI